MKTSKVVLFDIDNTLFNTKRFRFALYKSIDKIIKGKRGKKPSQAVYQNIRQELGYFDPEKFVAQIVKEHNIAESKKLIEETIWNKKNFEEGLYSETKQVLTQLAKRGIDVGIFSKGYTSFQKAKLAVIADLFTSEHIHIAVDKDIIFPKVIEKYKVQKLFLVDDALDVLYKAKKLRDDIFTIWVKRGIFAKVQKPIAGFEPDAIVKNLRRIVSIIEAN